MKVEGWLQGLVLECKDEHKCKWYAEFGSSGSKTGCRVGTGRCWRVKWFLLRVVFPGIVVMVVTIAVTVTRGPVVVVVWKSRYFGRFE